MKRHILAAANNRFIRTKLPNPGSGTPSGDLTFVGPATGQTVTWRYAVPSGYNPADSNTTYPLLLFFHGQSSNEDAGMTSVWPQILTANTAFGVDPLTGMRTCVFATIRATDSWYTNNAAADVGFSQPGAWPIETTIVSEFLPLLRQRFWLNGVYLLSGFSMGGFGAGAIALRHRNIFRATSLWQPPRIDSTVFNWSSSAPSEYASIFNSSNAKVDAHSWVQICDVERAAIIAANYPMYCMRGSGDPGLAAWNNAITKVQGFGITLTSALATTTSHNLGEMATNGFPALAIWYQQRIAP